MITFANVLTEPYLPGNYNTMIKIEDNVDLRPLNTFGL